MANRRMFSLDVVGTDKFLDLPASAQCLYFHLGMRADDAGFISNPQRIMKLVNRSVGDMDILVSKGYVLPSDDGIVVIKHMGQNNNAHQGENEETAFSKQ
ncbi:MAG: hypothetical protein HDR24_00015 [Lachnospiraceae bacterium]|nr:hypothetical protein [Lachnospiraceae bacterium]